MDSLIIYSIITGIFLGFLLLIFNRGYTSANIYLSGFFITTSAFLLAQYSGLFGKSIVLAALTASSVTPFIFLIGPFSFLYFRSIYRDNASLSKFDYLHFLMFILEFIGMIPYYFSSWENKIEVANVLLSDDWHVTHLNLNILFKSPINSYLRPLHLIFYLFLQWRLLVRQRNMSRKLISDRNTQYRLIEKWSFIFTIIYSLFLLSFAILTYFLFKYDKRSIFIEHSGVLLLLASILIVLLNLLPFLFPQILYGAPRSVPPENLELYKKPNENLLPNKMDSHLAAAAIKDEVIISIERKLIELMGKSKPWTDPNFSMATLAIILEVPQHHLRYYFNQYLNITFSLYRNRLRVEHAKLLLQDIDTTKYSIEGIGSISGFSSKSSYFSVFKDITGLTPTEYQRTVKSGR